MPIYEYVCRKCQHEFEALIRNDEKPVCEQCDSSELMRLLSVPAAHVSGGSSGISPANSEPALGPCGMGGCGRPECGP